MCFVVSYFPPTKALPTFTFISCLTVILSHCWAVSMIRAETKSILFISVSLAPNMMEFIQTVIVKWIKIWMNEWMDHWFPPLGKSMSCTTSQCPCLLGHSLWVIAAASFGRQRWKESKISNMRCAVEETEANCCLHPCCRKGAQETPWDEPLSDHLQSSPKTIYLREISPKYFEIIDQFA